MPDKKKSTRYFLQFFKILKNSKKYQYTEKKNEKHFYQADCNINEKREPNRKSKCKYKHLKIHF